MLQALGGVAADQGNYKEAHSHLAKSLALRQEIGDKSGIAALFSTMGDVARAEGNYTQAEIHYQSCMKFVEESGDGREYIVKHNMAYVLLYKGNYRQASSHFFESLVQALQLGVKQHAANCLIGLACVAGVRGEVIHAGRLFGAGDSILESIPIQQDFADRVEFQRYNLMIRTQFDSAAFETAKAEGRALTLEQAIAEARRTLAELIPL